MESINIKRSFGERVTEISEKKNIPKNTVETVLREYLDSLIESAKRGENIVIDNIVTIKVLEDKGKKKLRGRVSPSIKRKINE